MADENEFYEVMNNRFEKTRERYIVKKKLKESTSSAGSVGSKGENEELGKNFMDYFAGNSILKKILIQGLVLMYRKRPKN